MKRIALFILLLPIFFPQLMAQEEEFMNGDKIFYGGFTLGGNISEVIGDGYHGYHKVGLNAGPLVYAKFGLFGGSLELLYSQKGSRGVREAYSLYVGNFFEKYYLDLNYVEVPVQILIFPKKKIHFGAGISYSRLLKVREDIETDQPVFINPEDHQFLNDDWAYLVSGNYSFWKGWFVGARYQRSFKPIRTYDRVPLNYGSGNQYNDYITIRVTYLIP